MKACQLKAFMKNIPDSAKVLFNDGVISFLFDYTTLALDRHGGVWENGIGHAPDGSICDECTHFDCSKRREEIRQAGPEQHISQDIFSEKPKMKKETWSGGGFGI